MHWIDYAIIAGYLMVILLLGLRAGYKVTNMAEFATAGGRYGTFVVFATLSASYIGGGFTMGNAGKVYAIGLVNVVAIWGFSLKEILVGLYLAPRMKRFPGAISAGDIVGAAYGQGGKILTGVFGMLLCVAIVGAQVGAMGTIFTVFLGINPLIGIAIGCTILIVYSAFGGMRAVVVTDLLQFLFLSIGLPLVLVFGALALKDQGSSMSDLPDGHLQLFSSHTPLAVLSLFLVLFAGEALIPPYLQRLMIGEPKRVARGTLWSGVFSIPFFLITGSIGLIAYLLNPELESSDFAIPYVIEQVLPLGFRGFIVAGIISVAMSSADSFLNSAAVSLTHDIVKPLRSTPLSDRSELLLARVVTLVGGVAAVVVAVSIEGLLDILFYAYNFWSPIILVPLVAAFFGFRTRTRVLIAAAAGGILANLAWSQFLPESDLNGMIIGILANGVIFFALAKLESSTIIKRTYEN